MIQASLGSYLKAYILEATVPGLDMTNMNLLKYSQKSFW